MELLDVKSEFKIIKELFLEINSMINLEELDNQIKELDQLTFDQEFWNDQISARKVIKELKGLKNKQDRYNIIKESYENLEMLKEFIELGEAMEAEFISTNKEFNKQVELFKTFLLLSDEYDKYDAIIEIHPGAGGTESQDWANMLYRMYTRYAEQNNYKIEVLDYLNGEEAGLKSVTFVLHGELAYGYLKGESGVHRLVRISPFDSGGRRHTSFASVNVIPEIDDSIEVDMNENDLKIDTYRSSGAGGQSVNTTDSAVRITHLPTKTVVTVQNERSQIKNREKAMQILKSKLYKLEQEKKQSEISAFRSDSLSNSFGSQIRSYVMHPYSMVKDHRTNFETGNVTKVMDGYISEFIDSYLKMNKGE